MPDKTIIALSSAPGTSGISVIRLSGELCLPVLKLELDCQDINSHVMHHGQFRDPENGEILDQLNFIYMKAPRSYTGEDVLEIYPHGNPFLVQNIIDILIRRAGLRWANPGEFTRRGFENGKRDLMQSEAVNQLIHAGNKIALQNSRKIMTGEFQKPFRELKEQLKKISMELELDVDFSEEEQDPNYGNWHSKFENIYSIIHSLCQSWERGKRFNTDPKIAVYGAPNSGKSSFINAILKKNRLLVSDIAGTTRDFIEIPINLKSGKVNIIDTAGISEHAISELDSRAMDFTYEILEDVDYKILLVDGTLDGHRESNISGSDLILFNKNDLPEFKNPNRKLSISSKTGEGVDAVLELLDQQLFQNINNQHEIFIATERQFQCLNRAMANMKNALENIQEKPEVEILAFEIRDCHKWLAELIGEYNNEDILQGIFSEFCIGK